MNRYKDQFMASVKRLEVQCEESVRLYDLAEKIVLKLDRQSTVEFCKKLSEISSENRITLSIIKEVKDNLFLLYGYESLYSVFHPIMEDKGDSLKSLEEYLNELNALIGLNNVKQQINDLITYQKVCLLRKDRGLRVNNNTKHLAFLGNPGTGKTTVARIIGKIYKRLGILSKGHFIEVSRTDLIAGYQGQTALKVKHLVEASKGGILFIDEAYSITENENTDSYGRECLTELTKALEDYREDLVVIVAGYTDLMNQFFKSNPGLKSRFGCFIEFQDYNEKELMQILISFCKKYDYEMSDSAYSKALKLFSDMVIHKTDQFANGRLVRNFFDQSIIQQSKRVSLISDPTIQQLKEFKEEDFVF